MSLVWREQLSVGNDAIDSDHKHLIEIVNQVERGLAKHNKSELDQALDQLSLYAKTHFGHEEEIARAVHYGQTHLLHEAHEKLLTKLEKFKLEAGSEWEKEAADRFCTLLHDWLIDHVIKEDLLMKPALGRYPRDFDVKKSNNTAQ